MDWQQPLQSHVYWQIGPEKKLLTFVLNSLFSKITQTEIHQNVLSEQDWKCRTKGVRVHLPASLYQGTSTMVLIIFLHPAFSFRPVVQGDSINEWKDKGHICPNYHWIWVCNVQKQLLFFSSGKPLTVLFVSEKFVLHFHQASCKIIDPSNLPPQLIVQLNLCYNRIPKGNLYKKKHTVTIIKKH